MAKNLTNVHKKLDRILEKMGVVDDLKQTNRLLARAMPQLMRMVENSTLAAQDAAQAARGAALAARDAATIAAEAMRATKQVDERIAHLLAETRKH